jgi:hypothetical protein
MKNNQTAIKKRFNVTRLKDEEVIEWIAENTRNHSNIL